MSTEARRVLVQTDAAAEVNVGVANKPKFRVDPFWSHTTDRSADRWEAIVVPKIARLSEFPAGWDGYGANAISYEACMFAINVLNNVMRPAVPCPHVVPTASGSIQLEWHERGIDLEVKISGAYKCEVYFEDLQQPNNAPEERSLAADLSPLIRYVDELTRR